MPMGFSSGSSGSLSDLMALLQEYVFSPIMYLLYSVAVLVFFYGLLEFMISLQSDTSEKREQGKTHMIWGIIGFVIMLSVKGIIYMITNLFGINDLPVDLN